MTVKPNHHVSTPKKTGITAVLVLAVHGSNEPTVRHRYPNNRFTAELRTVTITATTHPKVLTVIVSVVSTVDSKTEP